MLQHLSRSCISPSPRYHIVNTEFSGCKIIDVHLRRHIRRIICMIRFDIQGDRRWIPAYESPLPGILSCTLSCNHSFESMNLQEPLFLEPTLSMIFISVSFDKYQRTEVRYRRSRLFSSKRNCFNPIVIMPSSFTHGCMLSPTTSIFLNESLTFRNGLSSCSRFSFSGFPYVD